MTLYLSNRDGDGKTDEKGHYKFPSSAFVGDVFLPGLAVTQNSPLARSVLVSEGDFRVDSGFGYAYHGWNSSSSTLSVSVADTANPRIDTVVLYIDKTASTAPSPPNNPGVAKIKIVAGTAAPIPSAPNGTSIQSSVGVGNPYIILADVLVGANATTISNSNITDRRQRIRLAANVALEESLADSSVTSVKIADSAVTSSKIQNNAVTTNKINNQSVSSDKLNLTNATGYIATAQATTNGSFTDLATVGPSITLNVGVNGTVLLIWGMRVTNSGTANNSLVSTYQASGANTISATDSNGLAGDQYNFTKYVTCTRLLTGLNPGLTTFTMKYRTFGGSASTAAQDRRISGIVL